MCTKTWLLIPFLGFAFPPLNAQHITFSDDVVERGYFDRTYLRYEAEEDRCITDGTFLEPTYDQRTLQSESSNQSAVQLIATGSFVEWTNAQTADGLTIRFSLPDNAEGKGTSGNLTLYINEDSIQTLSLSSYWAWQYILKSGSKYPDNIPNETTKFPRMRFDEMHIKLNREIPENATFRLVKNDTNEVPYTIDFVELEKIHAALTIDSITDENKVMYTPESGSFTSFVSKNLGKTIFLPEGIYVVDSRIMINGDNTKIIGAGMWHTEIYFIASSDDKSTYNKRGFESYNNNITLEGMYLNTINNKRYYNNDPAYQVGKGLMGSFGSNSTIKNLWAEHFECGGWIENANNLKIEHCRFRNNYADGMNLSYGTKNSVVEHCSYRNNGDDDMASWSRSTGLCENNMYSYSTSENNWRASSLGFFGGKQNKAFNIVIIDPMEAGFRVTCDFPGMPFSSVGFSEFYNISVYKGGVASGTVGVGGDLWGNQQGALHINSSSQYNLVNFKIYNIDFYDSKNDAIFIGSSSKTINNLYLKDITIDKTGRYGIFFSNAKGSGAYCNIQYNNIGGASNTNAIPSTFTFDENCDFTNVQLKEELPGIQMKSVDGNLYISGLQNKEVAIYDMEGKKIYQAELPTDPTIVPIMKNGIYIIRWDKIHTMKAFIN